MVAKKSSEPDEVTFFTNDINTSAPLENVDINLYSFKNVLIGTGRTDNKGICKVPVKNNIPYYAIATSGNEKGYIRMPENKSLSTSDFNVC